MVRTVDWRPLIVQLVLIKQQIDELDPRKLWRYRLPRIAATEAQLVATERSIGEELDPLYRSFLATANGWPSFYHDTDLFGTTDLTGGHLFELGCRQLSYIEVDQYAAAGVAPPDLMPIAASVHDLDLFVLLRRSATVAGQVIWFAGAEVDRFADFHEYFLAMIEYQKRALARLR